VPERKTRELAPETVGLKGAFYIAADKLSLFKKLIAIICTRSSYIADTFKVDIILQTWQMETLWFCLVFLWV